MNAAVYIRWSTDDQGTGTTLDVQRDACLRHAGEKGWRVAPEHMFIDDGVSGACESRPALDRLNHAVQQGVIATVIVYKLDRLARSPYLAYRLVEKDWHKKASLVSVTETHIDTTSTTGQLGFGIAAIFAAHERNIIRDRTMAGKRRRAVEGKNPGLRPPYGYALHDKRFVIADREAVVVRRVYEEYLTGRTDGQIARLLNEAGIRTRAGGPWHTSAVQRLLRNPAYKGTLVYRDISSSDAFPVIIAEDRWEQVQSLRSQKATIHPRRLGSESPYILSGRLTCARCGRPMNGRVCRNGKYENRYYVCTGSIQFRDCDCPAVRQAALEEATVARLLPLLDEQELGRFIAQRREGQADLLRQEIAVLEARLGEIEHELARVRQDYRRARIDAVTFNDLRTEIESEKRPLADSLAAARAALADAESDIKDEAEVREAVSLLHSWDGLSYSGRKQVIHLLTERMEWDCHAHRLIAETTI